MDDEEEEPDEPKKALLEPAKSIAPPGGNIAKLALNLKFNPAMLGGGGPPPRKKSEGDEGRSSVATTKLVAPARRVKGAANRRVPTKFDKERDPKTLQKPSDTPAPEGSLTAVLDNEKSNTQSRPAIIKRPGRARGGTEKSGGGGSGRGGTEKSGGGIEKENEKAKAKEKEKKEKEEEKEEEEVVPKTTVPRYAVATPFAGLGAQVAARAAAKASADKPPEITKTSAPAKKSFLDSDDEDGDIFGTKKSGTTGGFLESDDDDEDIFGVKKTSKPTAEPKASVTEPKKWMLKKSK